jgi:photosystem II protein
MAQTMVLMSGVSTRQVVDLKRDPLLQFQVQRLRPAPFSRLLYNPLPSKASSSNAFTTLALFKPRTKAVPKKVCVSLIAVNYVILKNK